MALTSAHHPGNLQSHELEYPCKWLDVDLTQNVCLEKCQFPKMSQQRNHLGTQELLLIENNCPYFRKFNKTISIVRLIFSQ